MNSMMHRLLTGLLPALLGFAVSGTPVLADPQPQALAATPAATKAPLQIFLAHAQRQDSADDPAAVAADEFRRQVGLLTEGRLKVEILADGVLGGNRDITNLVDKGVIQSALVTLGGVSPLYPPLNVIQLPYAFDRLETAHQVLAGPFGQHLADDMAAHSRLKLLGFVDPPGFHILTNAQREISNPAQLRELRIRAIPGAKVLEAMLLAAEAKPVKVSSREELSALSSGALQGQMNPASVVLARGIDSVQRYATLTNHLYVPYVWLFNQPALAALTPADAKAIESAARIAINKAYQLALAVQVSEHGVAGLKKRLQVRDLSAKERAAFAAVLRPATEAAIVKDIGSSGEEWMNALKTAISQNKPIRK